MFSRKTTFQSLARSSVEAYFHTISILKDDMRSSIFSSSFKQQLAGYNAVEVFKSMRRIARLITPNMIEYLDLKTYLVGDILTKVDRASMAHALEVRVPLLDHKLIEWISSLPPGFQNQRANREVYSQEYDGAPLPNDVLYRPKMGFAVPWQTGSVGR